MVVVQTLLQDEAPVDQRVANMAKQTLGSPQGPTSGTVRSVEQTTDNEAREPPVSLPHNSEHPARAKIWSWIAIAIFKQIRQQKPLRG